LTLAGRSAARLRQTNAQSAADGAHAIREMRDLHQGKVTISANEHTVFYLLPIEEFRRLSA
jgi:PHD/YefM family antitoxin component YafN of YafNO toxin-antitoxin module